MNLNRLIFPFILSLCSTVALAGWEPAVMDRFSVTQISNGGNFLGLNQTLTIEEEFYTLPANRDAHNYASIKNRVMVGIDRLAPATFSSPYLANMGYSCEVEVKIDWQEYDQTTHSYSAQSATKIFELNYSPEQIKSEKDLVVYSFENGMHVVATVLSVNVTLGNGSTTTIIPPNIYIENFLQVEKYFTLYTGPSSAPGLNVHSGPDAKNEITLNITELPGAEAYDIEWMFILSDFVNAPSLLEEEHAYTFYQNATRVTTTNRNFTIPLMYPRGILIYRCRARGFDKDDPGNWIYSEWTLPESGYVRRTAALNVYIGALPIPTAQNFQAFWIDGYEKLLNWQYQQVFAEEGKRGQSIQYFDGLLRGRQNIGYNYDEGQQYAIVGQAIYDFQGRPVISVLPVPVPDADPDEQNLNFKAAFNQNPSGDAYTWRDFDVDYTNPILNTPSSKTSHMGSGNGAAKYYSGMNLLAGTNMDYLPNSYGYPFAQTEYMHDGTGRIRRQGMVGAQHQLPGFDETNTGIPGKATEFTYSTPTQEELDRLFGIEVGNAIHYKKQQSTDPNGQVSTAYFDPAGRVIATALQGSPLNTPNLLPIAPSGTNETIIANINHSQEFRELDMPVFVVSRKFFVDTDNSDYTFEYDFVGEQVNFTCSLANFCYDCVYDVEISIKDEFGIELVNAPFNLAKIGSMSPETETCGAVQLFNFKQNGVNPPLLLTLDQGEYTITKRLKLSRVAFDYYLADYTARLDDPANGCLPSLDDLIDEEKALLDYTNCDYSCVKCNDDALAALNSQLITQTEYNAWVSGCDAYCVAKTECEILKEALILDMSPGGQFFSDVAVANDISQINLGNASTSPLLSPDRFKWLMDNLGSQSVTIFPALENILLNTYGTTVSIQSWEDVEKNWKPEFGEELMQYHPEYCYYTACIAIEASYTFDAAMEEIDNFADAHLQGYMNLLNESSVSANYPHVINDPFFASSQGSPFVAAMKQKMLNCFEDPENPPAFISIWDAYELYANRLGMGCVSDGGWAFSAPRTR